MKSADNLPDIWRIPLELGFSVFPVALRQKRPALSSWKAYQTERSDPHLEAWFGGGQQRGVAAVTGNISGFIDLDIDSVPALLHWTESLGADVLAQAPHYRSPKAARLGYQTASTSS